MRAVGRVAGGRARTGRPGRPAGCRPLRHSCSGTAAAGAASHACSACWHARTAPSMRPVACQPAAGVRAWPGDDRRSPTQDGDAVLYRRAVRSPAPGPQYGHTALDPRVHTGAHLRLRPVGSPARQCRRGGVNSKADLLLQQLLVHCLCSGATAPRSCPTRAHATLSCTPHCTLYGSHSTLAPLTPPPPTRSKPASPLTLTAPTPRVLPPLSLPPTCQLVARGAVLAVHAGSGVN
jgi:hypothetical protein